MLIRLGFDMQLKNQSVDCSLKALFFFLLSQNVYCFFLSHHFGLIKAKFGVALHKYNMCIVCN